MPESDLISVLKSSLYLGASDDSVKMVLGYCKATGLDPMQKPVHIVPMWDSKSGSMRDVVMPGIGLYRIQAARSGSYGGITEPEFGPDVTEKIGGSEITYPAWCRVTVSRIVAGQVVAFTAKELWKENYAVKGGKEKSIAPNAMWTKRPYAQLAKCAEAQALRKAFPEVGSAPTAEEMEGKDIQPAHAEKDITPAPAALPEKPQYTAEQFLSKIRNWNEMVLNGSKSAADIIATVETKYALSDVQKNLIRNPQKPAEAKIDGFDLPPLEELT
jgi:phage recombination protein Bet